ISKRNRIHTERCYLQNSQKQEHRRERQWPIVVSSFLAYYHHMELIGMNKPFNREHVSGIFLILPQKITN
ncbi:hypothetical protein Leryth_026402, partial [Lithospermum erythrorhizon]